jgi:hypothetical protein
VAVVVVSAARRSLQFLTAVALAAGCAAAIPPAKSPLELRELQTHTFDTADSKLVMKAMFNALQDDGYVVKNAVIELGLITATKETDLAPGRSDPAGGAFVGPVGGLFFVSPPDAPAYRKIEVRDFTGNVTAFGEQTKIRVSFQRKVLDNRGRVVDVQPIDDVTFYRDFFSRMDKSVYLQKERL